MVSIERTRWGAVSLGFKLWELAFRIDSVQFPNGCTQAVAPYVDVLQRMAGLAGWAGLGLVCLAGLCRAGAVLGAPPEPLLRPDLGMCVDG